MKSVWKIEHHQSMIGCDTPTVTWTRFASTRQKAQSFIKKGLSAAIAAGLAPSGPADRSLSSMLIWHPMLHPSGAECYELRWYTSRWYITRCEVI